MNNLNKKRENSNNIDQIINNNNELNKNGGQIPIICKRCTKSIEEADLELNEDKCVYDGDKEKCMICLEFPVNNRFKICKNNKCSRVLCEICKWVYFDKEKTDPREDRELELLLYSLKPGVPWSVKNQARMHEQNEDPPYKSSADAISQWPETATCVGIKLRGNGRLELIAPHGLDDITGLRVRPNPDCKHNPQAFILRLHKKDWLEKWPKLSIFYE